MRCNEKRVYLNYFFAKVGLYFTLMWIQIEREILNIQPNKITTITHNSANEVLTDKAKTNIQIPINPKNQKPHKIYEINIAP